MSQCKFRAQNEPKQDAQAKKRKYDDDQDKYGGKSKAKQK